MSKFDEVMLSQVCDEHGCDRTDPDAIELAKLEGQDALRKGCTEEYTGVCHGGCQNGTCPMLDWQKRHSEYKDDELAKKIRELQEKLRHTA